MSSVSQKEMEETYVIMSELEQLFNKDSDIVEIKNIREKAAEIKLCSEIQLKEAYEIIQCK